MNRIKELLQAKGMSQTEPAQRPGKCFNTVNLYAANKVQPPVAVLYRIADILDVDVRELLVENKDAEDIFFDISGEKIEITIPTAHYNMYPTPSVNGAAVTLHSSLVPNAPTYALIQNKGRCISLYINRLGAVKQLSGLDRKFFKDTCENIKDDILAIETRDDLKIK